MFNIILEFVRRIFGVTSARFLGIQGTRYSFLAVGCLRRVRSRLNAHRENLQAESLQSNVCVDWLQQYRSGNWFILVVNAGGEAKYSSASRRAPDLLIHLLIVLVLWCIERKNQRPFLFQIDVLPFPKYVMMILVICQNFVH